ncbi:MAG: TMEM165/GDT1 family protein [Pseudomonadota bacterium]
MLEALFISTFIIAIAEIGDKTQLLSFILAARYQKPLPIIFGIFAATIINHALAGFLGKWISSFVHPNILQWILGVSFIAMGLWSLIPDKFEDTSSIKNRSIFISTFITFFIAEMGDKTQIATAMLAIKYNALIMVVIGTTLGMMLTNIPAVLLGNKINQWISMTWIRRIAAMIFIGMGVLTLINAVMK